jgi:hypothetical protein
MRNLVKMTLSLLLTAAFGRFAAAQTTGAVRRRSLTNRIRHQHGKRTSLRRPTRPRPQQPTKKKRKSEPFA